MRVAPSLFYSKHIVPYFSRRMYAKVRDNGARIQLAKVKSNCGVAALNKAQSPLAPTKYPSVR